MTIHIVAPLVAAVVYSGSAIFAYPAYFALIAYVLCYVIYYTPRIIMDILECIGDICD